MVDAAKIRRESLRWYILLTLNTSRPVDQLYVSGFGAHVPVAPPSTQGMAGALSRESRERLARMPWKSLDGLVPVATGGISEAEGGAPTIA